MKKRLGEAIPHVPLLKLKPELAEHDKNDQETERTEDTDDDDDDVNCQGEVNDIHDSDISHFNFNFKYLLKECCFWRRES